jgi:ABC-type xylose transport system, permease component
MSNPNQTGLNLAPQEISSGHEGGLVDQVKAYFSKIKNGDMGALPATGALLVLTALFSYLSPFFLTKLNFANLFVQAAQLTTLAIALVFVLLIAEIDLSAGVAAAVAMDVFYLTTTFGGSLANWLGFSPDGWGDIRTHSWLFRRQGGRTFLS